MMVLFGVAVEILSNITDANIRQSKLNQEKE